MAAGQSSDAPNKPSAKPPRPVLSSHIAHAHAFATVPTPGNPSSARSNTSYFPLPTPPAPLRAFALSQDGESTRNTEGGDTTTYPTSVASSSRRDALLRAADKRAKEARSVASAPEPIEKKSARRSSRVAGPSTKTHTHSSASISSTGAFQFASAAPFNVNNAGSPHVSSPARSAAMSIAEIDCFFVQGSRSSTYSAQSPRSRPMSDCAGRSDHSAELTFSSNDEQGGSDMWMSDQAERERQREERLAFMKARKEAREELRKRRRLAKVGVVDELSAQAQSGWREAIKSQGSIPLNDIPLSRESIRERKRSDVVSSTTPTGQMAVPASHAASIATYPPPSGPGPPRPALSDSTSVDTLASDLAANLSLSTLPSEMLENPPKDDSAEQTPNNLPTVPALNRFDSDETEVGGPPQSPKPPAES